MTRLNFSTILFITTLLFGLLTEMYLYSVLTFVILFYTLELTYSKRELIKNL